MLSPSKKKKTREKSTTHKETHKSIKPKHSYKPLQNKRFYLDLSNYKGIENLKIDLSHLGAIIENFIVKEVNYVITSRCLNPSSKGSSSETTQQPSPISPLTPHLTSCDSPVNQEEHKKRVFTRAEILLERASFKKQGTSDVLENARAWAIPVWSLSKLLKFLSGLKESPLYRQPRNTTTPNHKKGTREALNSSLYNPIRSGSVSASKVQHLHEPFLKIEEVSRKYRPLFKELNKWPKLNLDTDKGVSPFDDRKNVKEEKKRSSVHKDVYPNRKRTQSAGNRGKSGYCELCCAHYTHLKLHLQSESHLAFTHNQKNYAKLDELISEYPIQLGETLYSGPPLLKKEEEENHVNNSTALPSSGGSSPEVSCAAVTWLSTEVQEDPLHIPPLPISDQEPLPWKAECHPRDPLALEDDSGGGDSVFVSSLECNGLSVKELYPAHTQSSLVATHNGHCYPSTVVGESSPLPSQGCVSPSAGSSSSSRSDPPVMVRLIQEPKSKADPHSLRRAARPPKRGGSVDGLTNSRVNKQSQKELRSRRVSCCSPFDRSDSETSTAPEDLGTLAKSAPVTAKKPPRNGEAPSDDHHVNLVSGGGKFNGDSSGGCTVNGVVVGSGKQCKVNRRVSRDDSDTCVASASPKTNGIVDPDNDRVDINLLLEISAKDRKRFESKKAKIKRKCADWMLITETEQYYNEKEEILRIKSREEEEETEDEEESESEDEDEESEHSVDEEYEKSYRKMGPERKNSAVDEHSDRSRAGSKRDAQARRTTKTKRDEDDHQRGGPSGRAGKGSRPRGSSKSYDDDIGSLSKGKGGKGNPVDSECKPRKRLSDAERFLRDNKEYYQFPETRDRLRRGTSHTSREHPEDRLSPCKEEEKETNTVTNEPKHDNSSESGKCLKGKNKKGPCKEVHKEVDPVKTEEVLPVASPAPLVKEEVKRRSPSPPKQSPEDDLESETLNGLYFSFEGAPVQETWYQTYQRFIDGAESNEFVYDQEPLQFVLPYEMPKEYFRDLQTKKSLLSKRKNELTDMVRKSPRCHASTLALFSNIFPTKKKGKVRAAAAAAAAAAKAIRTEEVSSGTSTPVPESTSGKPPSLVSDELETEEEMMFIGQCMEQIMKSALEENLCSSSEHSMRECRKSNTKRRGKGKKGGAAPKGDRKVEIPLEAKVFDNPLAQEVDSQFLLGLPRYLDEVSVVPEDTMSKNSVDLLRESCHCECTERTSCDESSSVDERTEISWESLSVCDSETVDSFSSNFSVKVRKPGPPFKKRRKNLTGWPTRKKRRPAVAKSSIQASDDNDSTPSLGHDDSVDAYPPSSSKLRSRGKVRRTFAQLLEPCSDLNVLDPHDRRASPRKRSSVLYMDTWPLRFRHLRK